MRLRELGVIRNEMILDARSSLLANRYSVLDPGAG
jgi:hypothetical protein